MGKWVTIIQGKENWASQVAPVVKNLPATAGNIRDVVWTLSWEDSPGVGNSNPLQYSCLENFMKRGVWRVTVHRSSRTGLNWAHSYLLCYLLILFYFLQHSCCWQNTNERLKHTRCLRMKIFLKNLFQDNYIDNMTFSLLFINVKAWLLFLLFYPYYVYFQINCIFFSILF